MPNEPPFAYFTEEGDWQGKEDPKRQAKGRWLYSFMKGVWLGLN
jgi:hypothetical protein